MFHRFSMVNVYWNKNGIGVSNARKILVMEDDSNINNLITEALQKEGYICTQAFSGTEGIMCIQKETFDLVILDLMLPGMTGEEWIAKIRPSMKVPIIVVSAKDELDHKIDVLTIGADDYLTKPFQIKELIVRVQVQMRRTNEGFIQSELCYKDMVIKKDTFQFDTTIKHPSTALITFDWLISYNQFFQIICIIHLCILPD